MAEATVVMVKHRERLQEIARVLVRHGLAEWAARGKGLADVGPVEDLLQRVVGTDEIEMSSGERLRGALTELGTTWIKFGQMLSLRPDVVGADVAAELEKLQANVPADPADYAREAVEGALGKPVEELFGSFESEPFASGSVAQVHRATLTDGTDVAVKVLHDGARRRVQEDVELMRIIADYLESEDPEIAQLRPTIIVGEFATMMDGATDLSQERANLEQFRRNFADEHDVIIPAPYGDRSSDAVLTMSMISGRPFTDRAGVEAVGWDVDRLVQRAADVYLEMIFRDGLFHADPHPGNFLLPDGEHMAILDFGDVGRLSSTRRRQLEEMVIAVGTNDVDSMIDVVLELTAPPPSVDTRELRSSIEVWVDRYLLIGVGQLDMNGIITSGMKLLHENKLVLPADLALLFRVLLRLQGLGRGVGTEVRVTELLQPYVRKMLAERFDPRRIARSLGRSARNWDHFLNTLPDELESVLAQIRTGTLGLDFRVHDADRSVDRLVDGLVTAASLVAGAQLISRRAEPMVKGFSVPGLVAAGVGILTWRRLVAKRRPHRSWVSRAKGISEIKRT